MAPVAAASTPRSCARPPASTSSAGDLEVPRPLRLVLTVAWSLTESIGLPVVACLAAAWLGGRDAGLIAGLAAIWLTAIIRKIVTGSVPGLLIISAVVLTLQTLRQPAPHHPGLHRFFQAATWLWAGIFLLLTAGLAAMMMTESASTFLMLSTAATIALVIAGAAASALWFRSVLRRLGLRLRFAPPEPIVTAGGGPAVMPAGVAAAEIRVREAAAAGAHYYPSGMAGISAGGLLAAIRWSLPGRREFPALASGHARSVGSQPGEGFPPVAWLLRGICLTGRAAPGEGSRCRWREAGK